MAQANNKRPVAKELAIEVTHGDGQEIAKTPGIAIVNHQKADGSTFPITVVTH